MVSNEAPLSSRLCHHCPLSEVISYCRKKVVASQRQLQFPKTICVWATTVGPQPTQEFFFITIIVVLFVCFSFSFPPPCLLLQPRIVSGPTPATWHCTRTHTHTLPKAIHISEKASAQIYISDVWSEIVSLICSLQELNWRRTRSSVTRVESRENPQRPRTETMRRSKRRIMRIMRKTSHGPQEEPKKVGRIGRSVSG